MLELIFVIVILGILAGIAIPRLTATRDDAVVIAALKNIERVVEDAYAYVQATGEFSKMSVGVDSSQGENIDNFTLHFYKTAFLGKTLRPNGRYQYSGQHIAINTYDNPKKDPYPCIAINHGYTGKIGSYEVGIMIITRGYIHTESLVDDGKSKICDALRALVSEKYPDNYSYTNAIGATSGHFKKYSSSIYLSEE